MFGFTISRLPLPMESWVLPSWLMYGKPLECGAAAKAEVTMEVAKGNVEELDLQGQPRVCVGCSLCGSSESTLLCSAEDIAAQQRFLERFYRSRWSKQNAATATDRVRFTQDYATGVVVCDDCGLLYRNPRPPAHAVIRWRSSTA
jgi:hypothetical protein